MVHSISMPNVKQQSNAHHMLEKCNTGWELMLVLLPRWPVGFGYFSPKTNELQCSEMDAGESLLKYIPRKE